MTRARRLALAAAVVVAAAVLAVAGWQAVTGGGQPAFERPIVLVSGRDDHGLVAEQTVDLRDGPDGAVVGSVPDGTLVEVLAEESTWLRVRTLPGAPALDGWVDDYYLRGTVHVVGDPPACPVAAYDDSGSRVVGALEPSVQVSIHDHHVIDGRRWVAVSPGGGGELVLVPEGQVQELPGPRPDPAVPCETIVPDPEATPHRH